MNCKTIELNSCGTGAVIAVPSPTSGYYRGVRFDHSGIILSLKKNGHNYVSPWFDKEEPYRHDNVCGPADVFYPIGYDEAPVGGEFLVIGVGVVRKSSDAPYDETKFYDVVDPGLWTCVEERSSVTFRQVLTHGKFSYEYIKKVSLEVGGRLNIYHSLYNRGTKLSCISYNHNFFVFDGQGTGPNTIVDLPYTPAGEWRTLPVDVPYGDLVHNGIRVTERFKPGDKFCIWDMKSTEGIPPYEFTIRNSKTETGIHAVCDAPIHHIQFWANHRVCCMEPKIELNLSQGKQYEWTIKYTLL